MNGKNILKAMNMATIAVLMAACQAGGTSDLTDAALNSGWSFWAGDDSANVITVNLPHDAQQQIDRNPEGTGGEGYASGGIFHYRKTVNVTPEEAQKHITLHFESVYRNARLLVNGKEAAKQDYGYLPMEASLDGLLNAGANTLEVIADDSQTPNSRWYSGAGIYRPVTVLVQDAQTYLGDIRISTKSISPDAVVSINTGHQGGEVSIEISRNGQPVAQASGDNVDVTIPEAKLWSDETPYLYQATVSLSQGGKTVEQRTVSFGIRQISWNAQQGLMVNGQRTLLRGGCLHHDNGVLGAAEYYDAAYRRLAQLKEYGYNAIRSAHNPCSEAVLRACDELGIYVMDELWDMWYDQKTAFDYSHQWQQDWQDDVRAMIRKDFSHPSVIMYSIGNENGEPFDERGLGTERQIVDLVHQLDNSRPVTAGLNLMILMMASMNQSIWAQQSAQASQQQKMTSEQYNAMVTMAGERMMQAVLAQPIDAIAANASAPLDIAGYNYGHMRYLKDIAADPNRLIVGSETMSYNVAQVWPMIEHNPQLIGDFQWTAWDYLGECGAGAWYYTDDDSPAGFSKPYPWVIADSGAFDLLGNPTGEALWCRAVWQKDDMPYIGVRPLRDGQLITSMWRGTNAIQSWSWPGKEGSKTTVEVYTSAPKVQLYVNNTLVGEQQTTDFRAVFTDIEYQPGTLRAVSISADGSQHEASLTSATGNAHLGAHPEKGYYRAGDLIYVDVNIEGQNGEVIANQDRVVSVSCQGARLLGFGSAAQQTTERFLNGRYPTRDGRSIAVLVADQPGTVTLTATADGLTDCNLSIDVK